MKKSIFTLLLVSFCTVLTQAQFSRGIESITSNSVSIIKFGAAGKVWASTPGAGCAVYTPGTGWTYFNPTVTPIMKSDTITAIELYKINNVPTSFMATTNGVYYFHVPIDSIKSVWDSLPGLPNASVTGIIKSPDGKLYVSTEAGVSIYQADSPSYHISDIPNSALPLRNISDLQYKDVNFPGFYAATPDSGYFYSNDTTGYNYTTINTLSGLIDNHINCILIKADTTKHYLGTPSGLSVYSSATRTFTNFTTNTPIAQSLPENYVTAVDIDCDGNVWVGTRDSGIGIYNGTSFAYLNKGDGWPSNRITAIDCNSTTCQIWIGTADTGIIVLDSTRNVIESFLSGINNISSDEMDVKIFPQPATDALHFLVDKPYGQTEIILSDLTGKIVITKTVNNESDFMLDVSRLSQGLYIYSIKANNVLLKNGRISVIR